MNEYVWNCSCGRSFRVKATAMSDAKREAILAGWMFLPNPWTKDRAEVACCSEVCREFRQAGRAAT